MNIAHLTCTAACLADEARDRRRARRKGDRSRIPNAAGNMYTRDRLTVLFGIRQGPGGESGPFQTVEIPPGWESRMSEREQVWAPEDANTQFVGDDPPVNLRTCRFNDCVHGLVAGGGGF